MLLTLGRKYKVTVSGKFFYGFLDEIGDDFYAFTEDHKNNKVMVPKSSIQCIEEVAH